MKTLEIGDVYYQVSFADPNLKIPRIEPMVFIGTNLFTEHEEHEFVTYYFREPVAVESNTTDYELSDEYLSCTEEGLDGFHSLVEAIAILSLVAAGVNLTRPPGERGLNL